MGAFRAQKTHLMVANHSFSVCTIHSKKLGYVYCIKMNKARITVTGTS